MDEILALLRESPPAVSLAVVFLAATLEYVFPPLPADTVVLGGGLVVASGACSFAAVYSAAVAGGVLGALVHYHLGTRLADADGQLRVGARLEGWMGARALPEFRAAFERYGLWVIAFNRAFLGVRAVTFLAAGATRLPLGPVMAAGLFSNCAWTALLVGTGAWVGQDWAKIQASFAVTSRVVFIFGTVGLSVFLLRKLWHKHSRG